MTEIETGAGLQQQRGIIDRIETLSGTRRFPGLLFSIVAVLHLPGFFLKIFDNDEAYIATVARVMSRGGTLYVDAVDRKPPGAFLIYQALAAITGSTALWIPRVAGMTAHTMTAILVWRIAARVAGTRAAAVAGVLSALSSAALLPADAQSANFEVFMLPFMCAAFLFAQQQRPTRAGIALAASTLMKQTSGITLIPLIWILGKKKGLRSVAPMLLGFGIPMVATAWYYAPMDFWFWVFGGANSGYLDLTGAWNHVVLRVVFMTAVVAVLNIGSVYLAVRSWPERREQVAVWIWLASAAIGVLSGTRSFGHYYWQVLPPLCVLAAVGIERSSVQRVSRVAYASAAMAVVMTCSAFGLAIAQGRMHYEILSEYVRDHTTPDQRIFVWGHLPGVFWDSDRLPASRVITTGFLTGHTSARPKEAIGAQHAIPGLWDKVMSDLTDHPPELIIDALGGEDTPSFDYPMDRFPQMYAYLKLHYHREAVLSRSVVYRRNGHVDPARSKVHGA
ncbi:MAG: DolP-mannose mannosyltransferase [Acidimicrobiia bacterium]